MRALPAPRPHVWANFAVDANGRAEGPVSNHADLARVHRLRERLCAVAVGGETWRRDRPRLTARSAHLGRSPRRQPVPVVFSASGQLQPAREALPIVVGPCPPACDARWVRALSPICGLTSLARLGVRAVLVEGGARLHALLLECGVVDVVTVFVRTPSVDLAERLAPRVIPAFAGGAFSARLGDDGVLVASDPRALPNVPPRAVLHLAQEL